MILPLSLCITFRSSFLSLFATITTHAFFAIKQSLHILFEQNIPSICSDIPYWNTIRDLWSQYCRPAPIQEQQRLLHAICSILANNIVNSSAEAYQEAFGQTEYFSNVVSARFLSCFLRNHHNLCLSPDFSPYSRNINDGMGIYLSYFISF